MAELSSILGGFTQGLQDLGKGALDMFGTGGAAIGDLIQSGGRSSKNQDDFRKWLYGTNSVKDASAKGLGTALNGASTAMDLIPVTRAFTATPLGNAAQGAIQGLSDELKFYGENADWGRAGERAMLGATTGAVAGGMSDALANKFKPSLGGAMARSALTGATTGAIGAGGNTAIGGGSIADILNATARGAGGGALLGGSGAFMQGMLKPQTYKNARTAEEIQADIDALRPVSRFSNNPDDLAVKQRRSELFKELEELRAKPAMEVEEVEAQGIDAISPEVMSAYGGRKKVEQMLESGDFDGDPLVMYHGVSPDKLKLARDNLDSYIVNPSLQIVNPQVNKGGDYGEIILLGDKGMLYPNDKYSGRPDTTAKPSAFNHDIYSPRNPRLVEYNGKKVIAEAPRTEYTPENVSNYMNKLGLQGTEGGGGGSPASYAGAMANQFKDLSDIVGHSNYLKAPQDVTDALDDYNNKAYENFNLSLMNSEFGGLASPEEYIGALQDYVNHPRKFPEVGEMLSDPDVGEPIEAINRMVNELPSDYFEGKATKPIQLGEFPGALLPEGFNDQEILDMLEQNHVPIRGYYGEEGSANDLAKTLAKLSKEGNRFQNPYLLSLIGLLGGGALASQAMKGENNEEEDIY